MSRLLVLWLLIVSLPIYGGAGSLLQILGPVHRHEAPHGATRSGTAEAQRAEAVVRRGLGWAADAWKAWKDFAHSQSHAGLLSHTHQHRELERHHHAPLDDSVITLGADESASSAATELVATAASGSATLTLGMSMPWLLPRTPAAVPWRWDTDEPRWSSAEPRRRDRPPKV
jgi:hypothetical protein